MKRSMILVAAAWWSSWGMDFAVVNSLQVGSLGTYGHFCFYDSDHDSAVDLQFLADGSAWIPIEFYSYGPWNRLILKDTISPTVGGQVWAVGDFDDDGRTDMLVQRESLLIFESSTKDSFPKVKVWKWPYEHGGGTVHSFVDDLDQDGRQDIFFTEGRVFFVLENRGDNDYHLVVRESLDVLGIASGDKTWGDFDRDGRTDLVTGYEGFGYPSVMVYECVGNDLYTKRWVDSVDYPNSYDVFSANDVDGDGCPEFMVGWHTYRGTWTFGFRIYETTGDDQYQLIFLDSIMGIRSRRSTAYSDCGDIDSDGYPEIVWAIGDDWYVYKAVGNNQFQRIFEAYPRPNGNGHMTTKVYVCDFNGNGYPEIFETGEIESASTRVETKVWEIEGVRLHRPNGGEILQPGSQFPITWEKFSPPGADSFSLFVSFNNGVNYQTIATIQQSNDTLFLWSVPDSLSDSCKLMIWAYGPPRAGENTPRGTAWDFSDATFSIGQTRVREAMSNEQRAMSLRILQNPIFSKNLKTQYSVPRASNVKLVLYNALGQVVDVLVDATVDVGVHEATLNRHLVAGVYFMRITIEDTIITKKAVILR